MRLVQFNNSHSVVFIQRKLTFHPSTPHYYMGWRFMTKQAATLLPHIGPSNTLELSTVAYVPARQANQHRRTFFMEQKEFNPGLKEIRLWGCKSGKE